MKTILIIDDDVQINRMEKEVLEKNGYAVLQAWSGTEALLLLEKKKPDLILLDLMLPGLSGEELLEKIRHYPVIVVSAKIDVENKVEVLMNGAADYLTKPFDTRELLARIAVAHRKRESPPALLHWKDLTLDPLDLHVTYQKQPVSLTRTEFALLKVLMENQRQAVSKSHLLDAIALDTPDCTEGSLKMHISNLRKKLRMAGAGECIESVWGIGFRMKS